MFNPFDTTRKTKKLSAILQGNPTGFDGTMYKTWLCQIVKSNVKSIINVYAFVWVLVFQNHKFDQIFFPNNLIMIWELLKVQEGRPCWWYLSSNLTVDAMFRSSYRDSFQKYLFFFSRSTPFIIFQEGPFFSRTDMNFPGGSICSSNRHEFSRRGL